MKKKQAKVCSLLAASVFLLSQYAFAAESSIYTTTPQNSNNTVNQANNTVQYMIKNGVKTIINNRPSSQQSNVIQASAINSPKTNNIKKSKLASISDQNLKEKKSNSTINTVPDIFKGSYKSKVQHSKRKYLSDEVLVKYKSGTSSSSKNNFYSKNSFVTKTVLKFAKAEVVKIPKNITVSQAINIFKADSNVEYVQPNYIYYAADLGTTDPLESSLWGLENTGQTINGSTGTAGIDIDLKKAWSTSMGKKDVVVGIIDTGIDFNHPDLSGLAWTNPKEVPGDGIDNDGNGYIDDVNGYDFFNNDGTVFDPSDGDDHGTHVAGTIAANANNNLGVVGIAPNIKIMSLKFLGPGGSGETSGALEAIAYAKSMGVKISNNSWGGGEYDSALKSAIQDSNMLFVASAGNDGSDIDSEGSYPAAYDCTNILSVAAIDNAGEMASFSNYGVNSVDVAAPGVSILSTVPKKIGAGAAICSSTSTYKTLFDGFGLEKLSYTAAADYVKKATNFFGITSSDKILIVQDDNSDQSSYTNYLSSFTSAFSGYNITTKTISSTSDGPDLTTLNQYKLVVWFTGNAYGHYDANDSNITTEDQSNLISYLDNGGKLFLSGRDAGWNIETTEFYNDYLHAEFITENDSDTRELVGAQSTPFELFNSTVTQNDFDYLEPFDSTGKVALYYKGDSDYAKCYEFYDGTSMAAPHVTGTAALLLSNGVTNPILIKQIIMGSTKPLESLAGLTVTGGLIDAGKAINFNPDDNIPGIEIKASNTSSLDQNNDLDDVYNVYLNMGEKITLNLSGDSNTDFDLHLYGPNAVSVNTTEGLLVSSEKTGSSETITYQAAKSGSYYVDVYGYSGIGNYTLTYSKDASVIDDTNPGLTYTGTWNSLSGQSTDNYENGTVKTLNELGSVSGEFMGSKLTWTGLKDSKQGIASIFIDGVKVKDVDLYSVTPVYKATLFEQEVISGKHTFEIKWTGTWDKAAKKTSTVINIDTINLGSENLLPFPATNLSLSSYIDNIGINFTKSTSSDVTSYNIYRSENGTDFTLISTVNPSNYSGNYINFLDCGINSPLVNKDYTYKVTAVNAVGESVPITATGRPLIGNSTYDLEDTSNHVSYLGNWISESGTTYNGGTIHSTTTAGASAEIPVNSMSSDIYLITGPDMGTAKLTWSDGSSSTINLNSSSYSKCGFGIMGSQILTGSFKIECVSGKVNFDYQHNKNIDTTAPSYNSTLTGTRTLSNTALSWKDNPEPDVQGYNVYRSTGSTASYQKINSSLVKDLSYVDTTASTSSDYSYTIKAVDYANLESAMSNVVKLTVPSPTASPAPSNSPVPTKSPTPANSPVPTKSPAPSNSPAPTASPTPANSPAPTKSPAPTTSPAPTNSPAPTASPAPANSGTIEDSAANTNLKYVGTWTKYSDSNASGGSFTFSTTAGSYVEYTFTGTGIKWYGTASSSRGIAAVSIDGSSPINIDCYSSSTLYKKLFYQVNHLNYGTHKIKILVTGNKNSSANNTKIDIDYFEIINPIIIKVEDTAADTNLKYTGSWLKAPDTNASDGAFTYSFTTGSTVEYTFTGTGINWYGTASSSRGIAAVSIDGGSPINIDCYNSTVFYKKLFYQINTLTYGTHKIKILVTGNKNSSSSNNKVDIDYFEVIQ